MAPCPGGPICFRVQETKVAIEEYTIGETVELRLPVERHNRFRPDFGRDRNTTEAKGREGKKNRHYRVQRTRRDKVTRGTARIVSYTITTREVTVRFPPPERRPVVTVGGTGCFSLRADRRGLRGRSAGPSAVCASVRPMAKRRGAVTFSLKAFDARHVRRVVFSCQFSVCLIYFF